MALNPKQQRFVQEYLVDRNATQAAIRAGYSKKTAGQQAHELLKKLEIAEAIERGAAKVAAKLEINAEWCLRKTVEIHDLARADDDKQIALKAIDQAGKLIGAYVERHEHTGKDGAPIEIAEVRTGLLAAIQKRMAKA